MEIGRQRYEGCETGVHRDGRTDGFAIVATLVLALDDGTQLPALVGLRQPVGTFRSTTVRGGHGNAIAVPRHPRLVATTLQVQLIAQEQLVALSDEPGFLQPGRRGQQGRFDDDMTGSLTAILRRGYDAEIDGFIGIVGWNDGHLATLPTTEADIGLETLLYPPVAGVRGCQQQGVAARQERSLVSADVQKGRLLQRGAQHGGLQGVLGLAAADDVRPPVEREATLIAAQPGLRIGCPSYIDAVRGCVVAAVNDGDRSALLGKVQLTVVALGVEVTVDEQGSGTIGAPKGLLSVEVEVAMAVDRRSVQCIVRTLEVAVIVIGVAGAIQRVEVQAADEAHLAGYEGVAMHIADMGLRDGLVAFWPV